MDGEACERFFRLDKAGRRKESKLAFRQFADSFISTKERDKWAREFLEKQEFFDRFDRFGIRIRQELFDEILWPFLNYGLQKRELNCQFWLAALEQNLFAPQYRDNSAALSRLRLLCQAFEAEPSSLPVRRALLLTLIDLSGTPITYGQAAF